ncbi:dual specificity phosphatase, catalytic domain-containing protein [Cryptosporidium muris RN66]|uniref:Dual specificity phosphatase, catalytic domain-containing protein n=1 Tax=Cryptosporidium muris (strain RN66) TaxID=441375 RepID=B6AGN4_CRYMR|nr:dual specificity phosphatase, catalytic domain-containing protein [Cryptosporidium muris RN66]EEA07375.1 dual specificity phosphatase, catalytic domain-containing protein [Cryptosporidium muris RN66]|eukprot:XP_002141724.1 dual specificity phosphatase, catalytic domain-containing protein [Cryptosporidium muris RN66]
MLTNNRIETLKKYRSICSEVIKNQLYLSGYSIACDKQILKTYGITHILNLSGATCVNRFPEEFEYRTYYVYDNQQECIEGVLYDALEWIDYTLNYRKRVKKTIDDIEITINLNNKTKYGKLSDNKSDKIDTKNNRILVHCQEGVSRSSSIVIGYLMWKKKKSFYDMSEHVRACRSISSPNIGFTYQLLVFQKSLNPFLHRKDGDYYPSIISDDYINNMNKNSNLLVELGNCTYSIFSTRIYVISKYNLPVCLINWKAESIPPLNKFNVYILRQSLVNFSSKNRLERMWIWIGSKYNISSLCNYLTCIRNYARQVSIIELNNPVHRLNIKEDISNCIDVDFASNFVHNIKQEYLNNPFELQYKDEFPPLVANKGSVYIIYITEGYESAEFWNVCFPNRYNAITRSISSPSISGMLERPDDFDQIINHDYTDKQVDSTTLKNSNLGCKGSLSSEYGDANSDLSTMNTMDKQDKNILQSSLSFQSSNTTSPYKSNKNGILSISSTLLTQSCSCTNDLNLKFSSLIDDHQSSELCNGLNHECKNRPPVVIPRLNINLGNSTNHLNNIFNKLEVNSYELIEQRNKDNNDQILNNTLLYDNLSSSRDNELPYEGADELTPNNYSYISMNINRSYLFRYPDYFSDSIGYFDADDLYPTSLCILVVPILSKHGTKEIQTISTSIINSNLIEISYIKLYLWVGSESLYESEAKLLNKEISEGYIEANELKELKRKEENENITDLEIQRTFVSIDQYITHGNIAIEDSVTSLNSILNTVDEVYDDKPTLKSIVRDFINSHDIFINKKLISLHVEFENNESEVFWDCFYN